MKTTPLTEKHLALGAKMAEFAGYNMPISYSGIKEEHHCVRNGIGIFDVSHMGEFIVRGQDAIAFVNYFTSNDVSKLAIGDAQYSCFPNLEGGIVDDLLVYRLPEDMCAEGEQALMLVVNASNIEKDWNWLHNNDCPHKNVRLINISDQTALMAVQGPDALNALQSLTDIDLSAIKYYTFVKGTMAGIDNVIISATGYTGSGGFELYVANEHAAELWDAVLEIGDEYAIQPIGLGARDTLRLEMGFCLYGNDIDDTTSPLEAGLGWITKLKKGHFIAADWLNAQKAAGLGRALVGFKMVDRGIPRHEYTITDEEGNPLGVVTSGTQSPTLNEGIGLGYVPKVYAAVGSFIYLDIRGKLVKAEVVKLPFLQS
jgi:aminomethyltransferase